MRGKIIKGIAGFYYVYAEDNVTYACKARGIFRKDGQKPLVGDDVIFTVTDTKDLEGNIDQILPRKNQLIRPAVANVDQALIIFAVKDPEPNFLTLDRFLVMMGQQKVPVTISFSKTDLVSEEEVKRLRSIYVSTRVNLWITALGAVLGVLMSFVRLMTHGGVAVGWLFVLMLLFSVPVFVIGLAQRYFDF